MVIVLAIILINKKTPDVPVVPVDQDAMDVRATVEGFGKKLALLSLLAPKDTVDKALSGHYGYYVSDELITKWQKDPKNAPGRLTSSPWPDRIEIDTVVKNDDGSFKVEGRVVEISTDSEGEAVAEYPVVMKLEKDTERWMITELDKGDYGGSMRITVVGVFACLPHKDKDGPQTKECASGIKEDGTETHYGLDMAALSNDDVRLVDGGEKVSVTGIMTPIEALSSDVWQKYDAKGVIRVEKAAAAE